MTTVTAGSTGTFTFTATANAASVTIAQGVRAVFVVTSAAGALLASDNIQASRVLGPYPVGAVMSLTAINGSVDYTAVDADNYFAGQVGLNADSQVIDEAGSPVSGGGVSTAEAAAVLFGDSHTRRNGPTMSDKTTSLVGYELTDTFTTPASASIYFGSDGYFVIANTLLGFPFRILHNTAVGGETIAQINARIPAAMAKYRPAFGVYMAGTNDAQDAGITTSAAADTAVANAIAGIQAGWTSILGYGAVVLAYTLPPRTSLNGFQRRVWAQINSWIRSNVGRRSFKNVYLAGDAAKAAGNPATGNWLASGEYGAVATTNSGDNIHGTTYGYYLIGCESAGRLQQLIRFKRQGLNAPELFYDATNGNNPYGNLLTNGKLLGTSGTQVAPATGTVPDSWAVQATPTAPSGGTIVTSKVSRGISTNDASAVEEFGEWFQVSMTGGTTAGQLQIMQEIPQSSANAWAPGDVISAALQFETDETNWSQSAVGASAPIVVVEFNANGGNGKLSYQLNGAPGVQGRLPSGTLRTPEAVIPAGTTRIFVRVYFRGQGTWRISDADCRLSPDRKATLV